MLSLALTLLLSTEWPLETIELLTRAGAAWADRGDRGRALRALGEARTLVADCPVWAAWQRSERLAWLAPVYARVGEHDVARDLWRRAVDAGRAGEEDDFVQHQVDSAAVLREVAADLARHGEMAWAREVACAIRNLGVRQAAMAELDEIERQPR